MLSLTPYLAKAQSSTLTVGTGTSKTTTFPINTNASYGYAQSIYLEDELSAAGATPGAAGYISSISYNLKSYSSDWSGTCESWVIYMGNTAKTTFSSTTDWVPLSSLTEVFNGTVLPTKTGWITIKFPKPFYWDGTSNLVVAVDENTSKFGSSMDWAYTSRTGRRSITFYSDDINPDPVSPPPAGTGSGSSKSLSGTPNIKLVYVPILPCSGPGSVAAGAIRGSVASGTALCAHTSVGLSSIGATENLVPGIKHQWIRRSAGSAGSWSAVDGATDTVLKADTLVGFEYRLRVVCSNTKDTAYSDVFQLPALPEHPPVVIAPAATPVGYCLGDTVRFNATDYTSGVYEWMIDSVVQYGWKFADMGATEPGEYMVRVTSPLSPCPAYSNKVKLNINDPGYSVTIAKPADSIICEGSSILLTAVAGKPGVTIRWRRDNIDIPFATGSSYLAAASGYYSAVAADGSSPCPAVSRNVHIIVKPKPEAKITVPGGTLTACENKGVVLKATPGYRYEWLRGGSTISAAADDSLVVKNSGMYSVKVHTADACMNISMPVSVNILASPEPVIMKRMPGSGSVELSTGVFSSYQWYRNGVKMAGATAQTISATLNGLYRVMVLGTNDCEGLSDPIEINESTLSIGDPGVQADEIRIYPNPAQSKVFIESPVPVQVSVQDLSGRTILPAQQVKEVDLGSYAEGLYLFTISDKEGKQLIKQQRVSRFTK